MLGMPMDIDPVLGALQLTIKLSEQIPVRFQGIRRTLIRAVLATARRLSDIVKGL